MRKTITITIVVIILVVITFMMLVFDWGRRLFIAPTTYQNATSTLELPIIVFFPKENQQVSSPIRISGKARGNWYFEAVFPIIIVDSNGQEIAKGQAKAQSDWMTSDYVNFYAEITYSNATSTGRALLVLSNDNPSGNPESEQSIFVPVILK